jgi:hypothetical protein
MILALNESQGKLHFKDKVDTNVFNKGLADKVDNEKCQTVRIFITHQIFYQVVNPYSAL